MFDVGFWELVIIAAVALVVAGPERLPSMVRDAGRMLRRIRRLVSETKYTIERELQLDDGRDLKTRLDDMNKLMDIAPDRDTGQTIHAQSTAKPAAKSLTEPRPAEETPPETPSQNPR